MPLMCAAPINDNTVQRWEGNHGRDASTRQLQGHGNGVAEVGARRSRCTHTHTGQILTRVMSAHCVIIATHSPSLLQVRAGRLHRLSRALPGGRRRKRTGISRGKVIEMIWTILRTPFLFFQSDSQSGLGVSLDFALS